MKLWNYDDWPSGAMEAELESFAEYLDDDEIHYCSHACEHVGDVDVCLSDEAMINLKRVLRAAAGRLRAYQGFFDPFRD